MSMYNNLNVQLVQDILCILYTYQEVYKSIKKNKRITSPKSIRKICTKELRQSLHKLNLHEYVDVVCVCTKVSGLDIAFTLIVTNPDSEYSSFFVERFQKIKDFVTNNKSTIMCFSDKTYWVMSGDNAIIYPIEFLSNLLYSDDKK